MESVEGVDVRLVREYPVEPIVRLYRAGGWWHDHYDVSHVPPMVRGSFAFAVAFVEATGETVGMGRCLSDGASDAYIQDVIVDPAYRGAGIGRRIVDCLLDACRKAGILWIGVVAEPEAVAFYEREGFSPLPGFVAMRYRAGD